MRHFGGSALAPAVISRAGTSDPARNAHAHARLQGVGGAVSPRELLEFAVLAEEVGFDSVVVSDHFQPWRHTGGHAPFSFAWLAALGERTKRVGLGTSVVTPTFRYHPSIVAQAMGTLGCLSPGRVFLGVGTGESLNEVPSIGIEWPDVQGALRPPARGDRR